MKKSVATKTLLYLAIYSLTVLVSTLSVNIIDTVTYKIVAVFIGLIIVSNCVAKLYALLILNEDV